jgi:hypothetical protein
MTRYFQVFHAPHSASLDYAAQWIRKPYCKPTEWADDLPPFPILSGELARAEPALANQVKRRHRELAA